MIDLLQDTQKTRHYVETGMEGLRLSRGSKIAKLQMSSHQQNSSSDNVINLDNLLPPNKFFLLFVGWIFLKQCIEVDGIRPGKKVFYPYPTKNFPKRDPLGVKRITATFITKLQFVRNIKMEFSQQKPRNKIDFTVVNVIIRQPQKFWMFINNFKYIIGIYVQL